MDNHSINESKTEVNDEDCMKNKDQDHYKCSFCLTLFATRSQLRTHMKEHKPQVTIQMNFKCDECDREFDSKQGLTMHIARSHSVIPKIVAKKRKQKPEITKFNSCNLCKYRSKSIAALKIHMEIDHKLNHVKSPPSKKAKSENLKDKFEVEDLAHDIVEEVIDSIILAVNPEKKTTNDTKKPINPDEEFLTNTARELSDMLNDLPTETKEELERDQGHEDDNEEEAYDLDKDLDLLNKRLDIIRDPFDYDYNDDEPLEELVNPNILENTLAKLRVNEVTKLREKIINMEHKILQKEKEKEEVLLKLKDTENELVKEKNLNAILTDDINKLKNKQSEKLSPEKHKSLEDSYNDESQMEVEEISENRNTNITSVNKNSNLKKSHCVTPGPSPQCTKCDNTFSNENTLEHHIKSNHKDDGDWKCEECDYQTNVATSLENHKKYSGHMVSYSQSLKNTIKCNNCDSFFKSKWDLRVHLKEKHIRYKPCTKFQTNDCEFDDECLFYHKKINNLEHICHSCGKTFNQKSLLMKHVKSEHGNTPCLKFKRGQCKFSNLTCLFLHSKTTKNPVVCLPTENPTPLDLDAPIVQVKEKEQPQDFRLRSHNSAPPDTEEVLKVMIKETIMRILPEIVNQAVATIIQQIPK